jgi:hypothetical protein
MFLAFPCQSSGATTNAVAASGLPSEIGGSSAVGPGRAGRPYHDQQHCYHWFECIVGGVLHLQHTQTSSNSSTIAADNNTV